MLLRDVICRVRFSVGFSAMSSAARDFPSAFAGCYLPFTGFHLPFRRCHLPWEIFRGNFPRVHCLRVRFVLQKKDANDESLRAYEWNKKLTEYGACR